MDELKHMEVVSVELGSSRDVHSWALKVYALEKNTNVSVLVTEVKNPDISANASTLSEHSETCYRS